MINYNSNIITDKLYLYTDPKNPLSFNPNSNTLNDIVSGNVFTSMGNVHLAYNPNGWFTHSATYATRQWRTNLNKSFYNKDFTIQILVKSSYRNASMTYCFDNRRLGPILYYVGDYLTINTFDGLTNKISGSYKIADTKANTWELVTCSYNVLGRITTYFSNNTYIGNAIYKSPANVNNYFSLGGNNDSATTPEGSQYPFEGLMGPCLIYEKILSLDEISQNSNFFLSRYNSYLTVENI